MEQRIFILLLDFLGQFIVWFILIIVPRTIYKKIKKHNKPIVKSSIFASLILAAFILITKLPQLVN